MAAYGEEVALVAYGVIGTCREPGRPVVGLPDDGAQPMDVEGAAGLAGGADVAAEQPLEPARPSPPAPPSRTVRAEPARTVHARADGPRDDLIPRKNLFRDIRLQENPLLAPRVRLQESAHRRAEITGEPYADEGAESQLPVEAPLTATSATDAKSVGP